MNTLTPLAAIEALLAEKYRAREVLEADIAALERTQSLLAKALEMGTTEVVSNALKNFSGASTVGPTASQGVILPGAWHDAALKVFDDGLVHTTAEIYEAAKAAVGTDLGYSAVASWLNRIAERGVIQKDGRGAFSRPSIPFHGQSESNPDPDIPF